MKDGASGSVSLLGLFAAVLATTGCGGNSDEPAENNAADSGSEFEPYFDGMTLDGFEFVGVAASDISIENGVLRCNCIPNGYFYKNEIYRNFELELELRYERPAELLLGDDLSFTGNSGVFVYLAPPHGIWPQCLEVQGSYHETGDVFRLPELSSGNDAFDPAALAEVRKPVGEWNTLVVTSNEGALTVEVNGRRVNQSTAGDLVEGIVALESEGAETHFRNVRIRRLP